MHVQTTIIHIIAHRQLTLNLIIQIHAFGIEVTRDLHLWWLLLLCKAIANGFHPTTHKINPSLSKALSYHKLRPPLTFTT